jgi:uncharacterized protein (TIGR02145 family)
MKKTILIILLIFNYSSSFSQQTGTFIDSRDGKTYKTVEIGNMVWMAENLAFKTDSGLWAYDNNSDNVSHYGYLYDWSTAKYACPTGWHLPSISEIETLIINSGDSAEVAYRSLIPGGNSGFSALFGGYRGGDGYFNNVGKGTFFWSSSPDGDKFALALSIYGIDSKAYIYCGLRRSCGFSVRCLKDN